MTYDEMIGKAPVGATEKEPEAPKALFRTDKIQGSEGGFNYTLVGSFAQARLGYRDLGKGAYRVRVQVDGPEVTFDFPSAWACPNGQKRYSIVVSGEENLVAALSHAASILAAAAIS